MSLKIIKFIVLFFVLFVFFKANESYSQPIISEDDEMFKLCELFYSQKRYIRRLYINRSIIKKREVEIIGEKGKEGSISEKRMNVNSCSINSPFINICCVINKGGGSVNGSILYICNSRLVGEEIYLCAGARYGMGIIMEYNSVYIDSVVTFRGYTEIYGGFCLHGNVSKSLVDIKGSIVVCGMKTEKQKESIICAGSTVNGNAEGNTINIYGDTKYEEVNKPNNKYVVKIFGGKSGEGNATGNIINIYNCKFFNENVLYELYGGYANPRYSTESNELNIWYKMPGESLSIKKIANVKKVTLNINYKHEICGNKALVNMDDSFDFNDTSINMNLNNKKNIPEDNEILLMHTCYGKFTNFSQKKIEIDKVVVDEDEAEIKKFHAVINLWATNKDILAKLGDVYITKRKRQHYK
jgi:hypothetical protein